MYLNDYEILVLYYFTMFMLILVLTTIAYRLFIGETPWKTFTDYLILNRVSKWHSSKKLKMELSEYLYMNDDEYATWVMHNTLPMWYSFRLIYKMSVYVYEV